MRTLKLVRDHLNRTAGRRGPHDRAITNLGQRHRRRAAFFSSAEARRYIPEEVRVFSAIIPRNVRLSEAPSFGQPIVLYDPRSRGAQAYEELAREVKAG